MVATQPTTGVYVKLTNRPGELERVARAFSERRINIDALTLETIGSTGYARFYARGAPEIVDALRSSGIEAWESEAIIAAIPNRAGELARVAAEIAAAGINVESATATGDGRVAFRTSDNERAEMILRKI